MVSWEGTPGQGEKEEQIQRVFQRQRKSLTARGRFLMIVRGSTQLSVWIIFGVRPNLFRLGRL